MTYFTLDFYKNLQPEITLYRIVMVDDKKDIDYEHPGTHYSISKKDLIVSKMLMLKQQEKS